MTSADFRTIADRGAPGRAERLFRAAIWSFCAIPRPSRAEIAQIEDLALPLYDAVSDEGRKAAAAALSQCVQAPPALVRRLADEKPEIAGPLLMRSRALGDIDLIALIGRHGVGHARAIAARPGLNPVISRLIAALEASHASAGLAQNEERVREQLRAMMQPAPADAERQVSLAPSPREPLVRIDATGFRRLRSAALSGSAPTFRATLADVLALESEEACLLLAKDDYTALMAAFRALDLSAEQAFLLVAAIYPHHFVQTEAIRLFVRRFRMIHPDDARALLRSLEHRVAGAEAEAPLEAANLSGPVTALRAS